MYSLSQMAKTKRLELKFIKSAVYPEDWPVHELPEVAVVGRSNAGKSSFLNALSKSQIAKVSQTPGKTRLINFFAADKYVLVDLPGYGFAARDNKELKLWKQMIQAYLTERQNLVGVILIMDSRRSWDDEEEQMRTFSIQHGFYMAVVLTKSDKLNQSERSKAKKVIEEQGQMEDVFLVSNTKLDGVQEVENFIFNIWIKPWAKEQQDAEDAE
jgi:GTP-binding protein